ncbi:aldo/keto reductase [Flavobacterium sp. K5-23]|uniref:aldo/keto reductase n=1 Tax=Flavobacterium sp. K5-23 TaxID=2746225 RepID=UPI00200C66A4|nr:aldo/keto reductase [Flavobacterium sp. K5-23]UQD56118.1 aldo/keto reductase [Flavobacterium sp. K5-23]
MISKVILGTVQMGLDYGVNNHSGKISFEDSCAILSEAFENGIGLLDTAEAYGNAHQVIGDFHRLNPKVKFKVITKIPHSTVYDEVAQKIKKYCEELHVDCLEVLMFHSFDSYKNCNEDLSVLESLKEQEVINHIGVSVYTNEQIEELLLDDRITVVQLPYNLLDNETVRGKLLSQLKDKGKIVHTRSAFLQGLFFKDTSEKNRIYQELSNDIESIKHIAGEENTTIANLALSYCLSQNSIDNVLIGVDSVGQLEENLKSLNYAISKEAVAKINSIKVKNTDLLNPSLWKK